MKTLKTSLVLFLAACSLAVTAQTQLSKGTWLFESNLGNLRYSKNSYPAGPDLNIYAAENKTSAMQISTQGGYFIMDRLVLGTGLNLQLSRLQSTSTYPNGRLASENKTNYQTFILMPFVRYYLPSKGNGALYIQAGGGYILSQSQSDFTGYNLAGNNNSSSGSTSSKGGAAALALGYNRFLSSSLAFNTSLGFSYDRGQYTYRYNTNGFTNTYPRQTNLSLSWNFGFTMFLGGNKASGPGSAK